jgi:hypothetical protein
MWTGSGSRHCIFAIGFPPPRSSLVLSLRCVIYTGARIHRVSVVVASSAHQAAPSLSPTATSESAAAAAKTNAG